jgi:hypothetical protein
LKQNGKGLVILIFVLLLNFGINFIAEIQFLKWKIEVNHNTNIEIDFDQKHFVIGIQI